MANDQHDQTGRFDVLDGMRGIAAIGVMLGHFIAIDVHAFGRTFSPFAQSSLAVDLFFVMSGFVLSHAYAGKLRRGMTFRDFVAKRVIRLYPLFVTGLIFGTVMLWVIARNGMTDLSPRAMSLDTVVNLGFLPAMSHETVRDFGSTLDLASPIFPANPPSWSLFFEMAASLCLPWLVMRRTPVLAAISGLCCAALLVYGATLGRPASIAGFNPSVGWNVEFFFGGFARIGFGFVLGMILHRVLPSIRNYALRHVPPLLLHPLSIYALTFIMLINPLWGHGLVAVFNLLIAIPLLVVLGACAAPKHGPLLRISAWLGLLSYPLYCLHFPVGRSVALFMPGRSASDIDFGLVAGIISIAVALLAGVLVDEPLRRFLGRMLTPVKAPRLTKQPDFH